MRTPSIGDLPSFGIKALQARLRQGGYTLGKIDSDLPPGSTAEFGLSWSKTDSWTGTRRKILEADFRLCKEKDGLYLQIKSSTGAPMGDRYKLVKKESNLKPGTFIYYILDHFSPTRYTLCQKLYYLPGVGEFVPRSILSSHGLLYSQQRKGHKDRYFFSSVKVPGEKDLRYRKRHYRGKETPFWRRYRELVEERDWRITEYAIGNGFGTGLIPPELEREVVEEYYRDSGRKGSSRRK